MAETISTLKARIVTATAKCVGTNVVAAPKVGERDVTIYTSPTKKCWRLVHDGAKVIELFETSGQTGTINTLFCSTNKEECDAEINRLGLKPKPAEVDLSER